MSDYAFLLDLGRCIGCQACVAACKTGNEVGFGTQYIHIGETTSGRFPDVKSYITNHRCYHCTDAACVTVCPTGALYKDAGLTRLDRDRCSGCSYCVDACPYDVPQIASDGRSSKCDGCADVVKAGGQPWCVKTCPSQALQYGDRSAILAEALTRVEQLKTRYPNAQLYGERQAGGLGLLVVLPDTPETFGLPIDPQTPLAVEAWQNVVQPAGLGLISMSVIVTGLAALIARRNHVKEIDDLHVSNEKEG